MAFGSNNPLNKIVLTGASANPNIAGHSRVILKTKSDSLALISSYQNSTDSEEDIDINGDAFLIPHILSETESDSDSESSSDGLPVFNIDSDVATESIGEEELLNDAKLKKPQAIKAHVKLDIDDLPPIKVLQISVKEEECLPFGKVYSIVETLVIIEALPDVPALNLESVLFTKIGEPLGEVFDVFGPVKKPYYTIRFNSRNDIVVKSLSVGTVVYCAPKTKYTQYVFIDQLAKMIGSDTSWKGDAEPQLGYEEYADGGEERKVKRGGIQSCMKALAQGMIEVDETPKEFSSFEERMNHQNTIRNRLFCNPPAAPRSEDWLKNAAPGTGRPMPEEGTSRANNIRSPQFDAPTFKRYDTPPATSHPFTLGNIFSSPTPPNPPASPFFPFMNKQTSPNFLYSPTPNHVNGNIPQSPFSLTGGVPLFRLNGPQFKQALMINQLINNQKISSQNFLSSNSPSFRGRFGTSSNQGWPSNIPFVTSNNCSVRYPQNLPCWQRSSAGQGLLQPTQPLPGTNNSPFLGSGPPPRFAPVPGKPFLHQHCLHFPGQNPPFLHSGGCPFSARSPPFGPYCSFHSPLNRAPPQQQFVRNSQQLFHNKPNCQQVKNRTCCLHKCTSFPPK